VVLECCENELFAALVVVVIVITIVTAAAAVVSVVVTVVAVTAVAMVREALESVITGDEQSVVVLGVLQELADLFMLVDQLGELGGVAVFLD
jgi:hypothetical protein